MRCRLRNPVINLFHRIEDGVAILRMKGGRFAQAPLYRRDDAVYAGVGRFYIRLLARGATTDPNTSWLEADTPGGQWGAECQRAPQMEASNAV